ncbi:hypothetical protein MHZ93_20385 [Roseomonas sp. ACRSG]|nr:hypothetical protein [Roseomonas sp. ACRSG]
MRSGSSPLALAACQSSSSVRGESSRAQPPQAARGAVVSVAGAGLSAVSGSVRPSWRR